MYPDLRHITGVNSVSTETFLRLFRDNVPLCALCHRRRYPQTLMCLMKKPMRRLVLRLRSCALSSLVSPLGEMLSVFGDGTQRCLCVSRGERGVANLPAAMCFPEHGGYVCSMDPWSVVHMRHIVLDITGVQCWQLGGSRCCWLNSDSAVSPRSSGSPRR